MSVLTATNRVDYTGNAIAVTFAFTFPVYQKSDLQVWTDDTNTATNAPEGLVLRKLGGVDPFDYIQSNPNFPGGVKGGSITMNAAPMTGMKVMILRVVSETQANQYGNFDKWDAKTGIEQAFDLLLMQVQQMQEQLNRSLGFSVDVSIIDPGLPAVSNPTPLQTAMIGFKTDGKGIQGLQIPPGIHNYTFNTSMSSRVVTFTTPGSFTWVVPAGVTRVLFEMGGPSGGGGGGGPAAYGCHGFNGTGGGWAELFTTLITPGEVIDILLGAPGAGGAVNGARGGNAGNSQVSRRAPNAADRFYTVPTNAAGGFGGQTGSSSRTGGAPTGDFTPEGAQMLGEGNWLLGMSPGIGYTRFRGVRGGQGGNGPYIVTQREIDLGENDLLELGNLIPATPGQPGSNGYVAIYY